MVTFGVYSAVMGHDLDARLIFTSLALFNLLKMPLYLLPIVVSKCVDGKASYHNIDKYLNHFEIPIITRNPDKRATIKTREVFISIIFYLFC